MSRIFQRFLSLALTVILVITLIPAAAFHAAATSVRLDLSAENGYVAARGEDFTVDVLASANSGFCAMTLLIEYDESAFELIEKENGSTVDEAYFVPNASLDSKYATLAWQNFTANEDWTETGVLAKLHFTVKDDAPVEDHYIRVTPVPGTALSVSGNGAADVNITDAVLYINVTAASAPSPAFDLFLSSDGSLSNDGRTAASPMLYLDQALRYVAEHPGEIINKEIVLHLSGNVYSADPVSGNGNNDLGLAGLDRMITITSTNASVPGALIHSYNADNGSLSCPAIILQNPFTLRNVRFAAFPVQSFEGRDFYCNGNDFIIGSNCRFTDANHLDDPDKASLRFSLYGGGWDANTLITGDYSITVSTGKWYQIAPLMTRGGKIASGKVKCEVTGDAEVTERLYAGPCAEGDTASNAFYLKQPLTTDVEMTISGEAKIPVYIGGAGEFAKKDMVISGNVTTTVAGSPVIDSYLGGGDMGTRTGTTTNIIRGGTFNTRFFGGSWGAEKASDNGTNGDTFTSIYRGTFNCSVYGAGCYTPTVGDVSLTVAGNGVNSSTDNCTYVGSDKSINGGSLGVDASVTGDITVTLSGCYLDASVYTAGRSNVYGDVRLNFFSPFMASGRNVWLGTYNNPRNVYGDVYFRMTGGSIPGSFYCCSYRDKDDGNGCVNGNAYLDISGGTFNRFFINSNPAASTPLYGKLLGNVIMNVDVSHNNVTFTTMSALDGILIDRLTGGDGTLKVPSGKYVIANHFSGRRLKAVTSGFTKSGAFLTLPQEDVAKTAKSVIAMVGSTVLSDKVAKSGREHIWYKTDAVDPIYGVTLLPDDQVGMRVIFDSNSPTADGQYQYSADGGNTYETVSYETGYTVPGVSGSHAHFLIPGIEPSRFGDTILLRSDSSAVPVPYSISAACVTVIDTKNGGKFVFDDGFRALAQSILNYGNCARDCFDYNTDSKVTAKNPVSLEKCDSWDNDNVINHTVTNPVFVPVGSSLVLRDQVYLNVWLRINGNIDPSTYTVKVNGASSSGSLAKRDGGYCCFEMVVSGRDIKTAYTFQVFQGTKVVSDTITTSAGSYCYMIQAVMESGVAITGNDAALIALCESLGAMFRYRDAYFRA